MYKTFRVKNFRCFKDLQINDLGRVNLIAGKNNTGKTALMESMYLHTRPQEPEVLLHIQQARDLDTPEIDLPSYWSHFFNAFDSQQDIEIDGANDKFCHNLTVFEAKQVPDYEHIFRQYAGHLLSYGTPRKEAIKQAESLEAAIIIQYKPDQGSQQFAKLYSDETILDSVDLGIQSNFIPVQGRPDKGTAVEQFSNLVREVRLSKLVETLNALEPRLIDLRLLKEYGEEMLWGQVSSSYIPLKLMGEGMNRVCHFIVTLMSYPNGYVFIDEIENGIHYSVQKDVWKAIGKVARDLEVQVFATTHSLEMIRAAYEAFSEENKLDEFRYHRLDRGRETGDIEAVTYNELDMEAVASFDFDHEVR